MKLNSGILLILLTISSTLGYKSYAGYQVLSTPPLDTDELVAKVVPLLDDTRFSFWEMPVVARSALIMSAPEHVAELRDLLQGLQLDVQIADLGTIVEEERAQIEDQTRNEIIGRNSNLTFHRYMKYKEIDAYLDEVVSTFPEMASLEEIGTSYEGRRMRVLKVSRGGAASRPGVFVDAGIHAAEWLGPPVALYTIFQLTAHAHANQKMLDLADWYILPVANPDGYVYAWTEERFWRKNRKPNTESDCIGVDLNRNFGVRWGEGKENRNPCKGVYHGGSAHSEPESKAIAAFLRSKGQAGQLSLYMALHAYSQYLLYPYGYKTDLPAPEMVSAAEEAVAAVTAVRGTKYIAGSIAKLLYPTYGSSQDYAHDVARVPFTYTWELPPGGWSHFEQKNYNLSHFNQPASEILPVCQETWEGMKVLVRHATAPPATTTSPDDSFDVPDCM